MSMIVTICGSMRFFDLMLKAAADETAAGNIVLAPFSVVAPEGRPGSEFKAMLDRLHREKIDMSERIIVVSDETGYVGDSTTSEIFHAEAQGKRVDVRKLTREEHRHGDVVDQAAAE